MVSVRPSLNIRREALSYVAQHRLYILRERERGEAAERQRPTKEEGEGESSNGRQRERRYGEKKDGDRKNIW